MYSFSTSRQAIFEALTKVDSDNVVISCNSGTVAGTVCDILIFSNLDGGCKTHFVSPSVVQLYEADVMAGRDLDFAPPGTEPKTL